MRLQSDPAYRPAHGHSVSSVLILHGAQHQKSSSYLDQIRGIQKRVSLSNLRHQSATPKAGVRVETCHSGRHARKPSQAPQVISLTPFEVSALCRPWSNKTKIIRVSTQLSRSAHVDFAALLALCCSSSVSLTSRSRIDRSALLAPNDFYRNLESRMV